MSPVYVEQSALRCQEADREGLRRSRQFAQRGGMSETAGKTVMLTTTPDDIARAAALLSAGALVAFPTETVYGLGADATNPQAIASLYAAKGRPQFNP